MSTETHSFEDAIREFSALKPPSSPYDTIAYHHLPPQKFSSLNNKSYSTYTNYFQIHGGITTNDFKQRLTQPLLALDWPILF